MIGRIAAAVDYLVSEFGIHVVCHVSEELWIEAFGCTEELDTSEGICGLSLLPVSQVWAFAQAHHAQLPEQVWQTMIDRSDCRW